MSHLSHFFRLDLDKQYRLCAYPLIARVTQSHDIWNDQTMIESLSDRSYGFTFVCLMSGSCSSGILLCILLMVHDYLLRRIMLHGIDLQDNKAIQLHVTW